MFSILHRKELQNFKSKFNIIWKESQYLPQFHTHSLHIGRKKHYDNTIDQIFVITNDFNDSTFQNNVCTSTVEMRSVISISNRSYGKLTKEQKLRINHFVEAEMCHLLQKGEQPLNQATEFPLKVENIHDSTIESPATGGNLSTILSRQQPSTPWSPWTKNKLHQLAKEIHCDSVGTIKKYIFYNYITGGGLSLNNRTLLKSWLKSNSYSNLEKETLEKLSIELRMNPSKIRRHLYLMHYKRKDSERSLTPKSRQILKKWLESHSYEDLTEDVLMQFEIQLNCSKRKIRNYMYGLNADPSQKLTSTQRKIIRTELLSSIQEGCIVNEELVQNISLKSKLEVGLVGAYIKQYMLKSNAWFSKDARKTIHQWMDENKDEPLTNDVLKQLSQKTSLSETQVKAYVHALQQQNEKLASHQKEILLRWIDQNSYVNLTKNVLQSFSKEFNIGEGRIRHYIYNTLRRRSRRKH